MIYLSHLVASPEDDRDYPYIPVASFPDAAEFATWDIEDQLTIGSCTANAVVSACEAIKPGHLSRLFNYYHTRLLEGRLGSEGAVLRDAVKVATKAGLPSESLWPYDITKVETAPTPDVYDEASKHKVLEYLRIDLSGSWLERVNNIKSALSQGFPVVFAMPVTTQFMQLTKSTCAAYAGAKFPWWPVVGNHAMMFYGYDTDFLKAENSWGTSWGDDGRWALRIGLVEEIFEAWAITGFDGVVPPAARKPRSENYRKAYRLYQAAFNRVPDNGGLKYWIGQLDAGMPLQEVAARFIDSNEFRSLYGTNPSNADFLTRLYNNVLHRDPDPGGYAWWLDQLNTGQHTQTTALMGFSESPENKAAEA